MLGVSAQSATHLLRNLADRRLIGHVRHGHWALDPTPGPIAYAGWVTVPAPSYVSLQTALRHHGLIQQIPAVIYVVSLAKTRAIETSIGTYSIHQIAPPLFGGFEVDGSIRMATAEKAVFDFFYLSRRRSGLFAGLPEVEIPAEFRSATVWSWVDRVPDQAVRSRVAAAVEPFLHRRR